jgi:hypothetical protein
MSTVNLALKVVQSAVVKSSAIGITRSLVAVLAETVHLGAVTFKVVAAGGLAGSASSIPHWVLVQVVPQAYSE